MVKLKFLSVNIVALTRKQKFQIKMKIGELHNVLNESLQNSTNVSRMYYCIDKNKTKLNKTKQMSDNSNKNINEN